MDEKAWHVAVETLARELDSKKTYIDYMEKQLCELREENAKLKKKLDDLTF